MVCISAMVLVKDRNPLRMRILRLVRVEMDYTMGKLENARFTFSSSAQISLKILSERWIPWFYHGVMMSLSDMFWKLLRKIECIVSNTTPLAFFIHSLTFWGKEHKGRSLVTRKICFLKFGAILSSILYTSLCIFKQVQFRLFT